MKKTSLIPTEKVNPRTKRLDVSCATEIAEMLSVEDLLAAQAVKKAAPAIARAIDCAAQTYLTGRKIFFIGAGTSGRLGILEAVECVPTFNIKPTDIQGILAGGHKAMFRSYEGAEDDTKQGAKDILAKARKGDFVLGLTASGTTPYTLSALQAAKKTGCHTALLTSNGKAAVPYADIFIFLSSGAEPLTGSTRMKAGTATKLALNAITTGAMARAGKVYQNLMVDVQPSNQKLIRRALRLVSTVSGADEKTAQKLLVAAGKNVKVAIVMHLKKCPRTQAETLLRKHRGFLREVLRAK